MKDITTTSTDIASKILSDIEGRGGLQDAWDSIDPDLQSEIFELWVKTVKVELSPLYKEINLLSLSLPKVVASNPDDWDLDKLKEQYPNLHLIEEKFIVDNNIYVNGIPKKFIKHNVSVKELLDIHTNNQIYIDTSSLPSVNAVII